MKKARWLAHYAFDPEEHASELKSIFEEIEGLPIVDDTTLRKVLGRHPKHGSALFSKTELIQGYGHMVQRHGWPGDWEAFRSKVLMKPVRTRSGVTPLTLLSRPWPCPGRCIFCPDDPEMPKSYLGGEPGAQRAARHAFDPFEQAQARLLALRAMGHPTEKIELLVLGGTWSAYPRSYQLWFVRRAFEAMNQLVAQPVGDPAQGAAHGGPAAPDQEPWTVDSEPEARSRLREAHHINETACCRCVGLTVETRPDSVTETEVVELRRLGVTRVQLGYQHVSDRVLELNERGHTVSDSRRATAILRSAAFKVQAHWMANLHGSTPEDDLEDFGRLFDDPGLRPDELKIYPTSLVASARLGDHYRSGRWRPYDRKELVELLCECLVRVPPYCRISRVIRDIPGNDIVAGERVNGLRDLLEVELRRRGTPCQDIRSREIGRRPVQGSTVVLQWVEYQTTTACEAFLQALTPDDRLAGFLRLSLPRAASFLAEIGRSALVREIHVYGAAVAIGAHRGDSAQHSGLGRRLVDHAVDRAHRAGYSSLAVISAVGTRNYYRKLGFVDGELYQHRSW